MIDQPADDASITLSYGNVFRDLDRPAPEFLGDA